MSWFKKEVQNWDMVGQAMERQMASDSLDWSSVDDDSNLDEVDLKLLKEIQDSEAKQNKLVTDALSKLTTSGE